MRKFPPNNLKRLRDNAGLTQQELADRLVPETTQDLIGKLERGERELRKKWSEKLSVPLQCNPNDFFDHNVKAKYFGSLDTGWGDQQMHKKAIYDITDSSNEGGNDEAAVYVDTPPGSPYGMGCIAINNNTMLPLLRPGDKIFFTAPTKEFELFINEPVVVWLKDGKFSVRIIRRSAVLGKYDLDTYTGESIVDCDLESVAKIKYIERA